MAIAVPMAAEPSPETRYSYEVAGDDTIVRLQNGEASRVVLVELPDTLRSLLNRLHRHRALVNRIENLEDVEITARVGGKAPTTFAPNIASSS